jgi:hypothetical protein
MKERICALICRKWRGHPRLPRGRWCFSYSSFPITARTMVEAVDTRRLMCTLQGCIFVVTTMGQRWCGYGG